jgi:hypothetical protein
MIDRSWMPRPAGGLRPAVVSRDRGFETLAESAAELFADARTALVGSLLNLRFASPWRSSSGPAFLSGRASAGRPL